MIQRWGSKRIFIALIPLGFSFLRVSTDGQTLDAQITALKAAGAEKVYSEKQSGAKTDRAALARVLAVTF
jgi:DNA invertase Pin-like site-specific DNA recombinase